jgi:hypothetical protein
MQLAGYAGMSARHSHANSRDQLQATCGQVVGYGVVIVSSLPLALRFVVACVSDMVLS